MSIRVSLAYDTIFIQILLTVSWIVLAAKICVTVTQ